MHVFLIKELGLTPPQKRSAGFYLGQALLELGVCKVDPVADPVTGYHVMFSTLSYPRLLPNLSAPPLLEREWKKKLPLIQTVTFFRLMISPKPDLLSNC